MVGILGQRGTFRWRQRPHIDWRDTRGGTIVVAGIDRVRDAGNLPFWASDPCSFIGFGDGRNHYCLLGMELVCVLHERRAHDDHR